MKNGYESETNRKDSLSSGKEGDVPSHRDTDLKFSPASAVRHLDMQSNSHPLSKGDDRHCK